ncbi:[NiFe]-hydrogenase assembly chaperone HybE [Poseidonocella sp. HB161398]|uniref:[NiFe]-hydrogenase assembly chaperone HybE n=1 Tax=Poseidonocella sp. HB161398 TaxID=2320855 RepID=UPI0011096DD6|nr:[NiFe]-hydrogenase assembly chaperone HybE [Poseidonocella sp. HB161398]
MSGFEGSYLGANDKISPLAVMECKICWTPYDPAEGDDTRQIDEGTPFAALPGDWSCPNCGAPKEQFIVQDDPGAGAVLEAQRLAPLTAQLEDEFTEIWHGKMRDVPMVNKALRVEAAGFRYWQDRPLGVLISPWFMNLVLLPGEGEDWSGLEAGAKEVIAFPSGEYEFLHNTRGLLGGYKACSLFSPMGDFPSQAHAAEVARAVMVALFQEEHRAETDRSADIRAAREAELAAAAAPEPEAEPSRRAVITAGFGE